MSRSRSMNILIPGAALLGLLLSQAIGHPGHLDADHEHLAQAAAEPIVVAAAQDAAGGDALTSGQGDLKFRVLYRSDHLPPEAQAVLVNAHGGFAVDRRAGQGEVYFALPGAGIIRISGDLKSARMVPTNEAMKGPNMHNATIWRAGDGAPLLTFPSNGTEQVFTTTLGGELLHTLGPPGDFDFGDATVNKYFAEGGKFVPTDTESLGGAFYITTGYSPLDYVLSAKISSIDPVKADWQPHVFGGRGGGPGQFGTGHGITIVPGGEELAIADRPNSEIDRYSPAGKYLGTIDLPKGSFPCDVDYTEGYTIVGCLHGPDRDKGAPIYILKGEELVSTIMPKAELGLANFQHIHNAVMVKIGSKLYLIAQAWNPGDFAILEQVGE